MTEQELTALANERIQAPYMVGTSERALALGYLTLKAERDALKERLEATYVLARSGLGRQLSQVPSEPHAPGQQKVEL